MIPEYQWEELNKLAQRIYKHVQPRIRFKQFKISDYNPKPAGEKRTYPQDWPAYNPAKMNEGVLILKLLKELLDNTNFPETKSKGRKPFSLSEKLFYVVIQAYNYKSSRSCISALEICRQLGYVTKKPHFNTVLKYLRDPQLETWLKHLINVSGMPLQQVETDFAVDSSGFSTRQYDSWFNARTGKDSERRRFKKAHLTVGVKTNIITAVNITPGTCADSPEFPDLIQTTRRIFEIREVSADKAYSSRKNFQTVKDAGGVPYIPFKKNTAKYTEPKGCTIWKQLNILFNVFPEEFKSHYHKRSNSESTFHMLKEKFGSHLRSKKEISQNNEVLAKCLCHNLCVLIQEAYELGIKPDFQKCAKIPLAHK